MTDTLCYFTTFVCHYDQLPLVAKRYQERLTQIAALPGHAIVLAAEEVCDIGRESLIFDLLIKEILDEPWTAEKPNPIPPLCSPPSLTSPTTAPMIQCGMS